MPWAFWDTTTFPLQKNGARAGFRSHRLCLFLADSTTYSHKHENISVIRASGINSAGMAVSWSWEEHVWVDVAGLMSEKVLGTRVSSPAVASLAHTDRLSVLQRFSASASRSIFSSWSDSAETQSTLTYTRQSHKTGPQHVWILKDIWLSIELQ